MKFYFYLFMILSGLNFFGCSNCDTTKKENNLETLSKNINTIAKQKFNSKYKILRNQAETYALVIKNIDNSKSPVINKQSFFIYDFSANEIIFEDDIVNGNVYWETDDLITVTRITGIIKKYSENKMGIKVYSFDVISRRKN